MFPTAINPVRQLLHNLLLFTPFFTGKKTEMEVMHPG
jgi:hypothetical protein